MYHLHIAKLSPRELHRFFSRHSLCYEFLNLFV